MFHYSNLGQFGTHLKQYADLDGYVPEAGDDLTDFRYPEGWFDGSNESANPDDWIDFVFNATAATTEALESINRWRETNP